MIVSTNFKLKCNVPMSAETSSNIYYDPKDSGSLDIVKRLMQRAMQFHVKNVTRKTIQEYLKS